MWDSKNSFMLHPFFMAPPKWTLYRDKSPWIGDKPFAQNWLSCSMPETFLGLQFAKNWCPQSCKDSGHTKRPPASPSQKNPAGTCSWCSCSNTQATPPQGEHFGPKLLIGRLLYKCYQCHFPVCVLFLFLFCFYSSLLILTVSSNCLPCGMKISQAYVNSLSLWNSWLSLESP